MNQAAFKVLDDQFQAAKDHYYRLGGLTGPYTKGWYEARGAFEALMVLREALFPLKTK